MTLNKSLKQPQGYFIMEETIRVVKNEHGYFKLRELVKPDVYGGIVKITSTSFWEIQEYDDNSFVMTQTKIGYSNPTLKFGPLSTSLNELMKSGFFLSIDSFSHRRRHALTLTNDKERYKVGSLFTQDLKKYEDLSGFVRQNIRPDYQNRSFTPKKVLRGNTLLNKVNVQQADPLDELKLKYPVTRKPVEFIGNQTIEEYVKTQLKQHRRLHYVGE